MADKTTLGIGLFDSYESPTKQAQREAARRTFSMRNQTSLC